MIKVSEIIDKIEIIEEFVEGRKSETEDEEVKTAYTIINMKLRELKKIFRTKL